jgi:hypothetical protein
MAHSDGIVDHGVKLIIYVPLVANVLYSATRNGKPSAGHQGSRLRVEHDIGHQGSMGRSVSVSHQEPRFTRG